MLEVEHRDCRAE